MYLGEKKGIISVLCGNKICTLSKSCTSHDSGIHVGVAKSCILFSLFSLSNQTNAYDLPLPILFFLTKGQREFLVVLWGKEK